MSPYKTLQGGAGFHQIRERSSAYLMEQVNFCLCGKASDVDTNPKIMGNCSEKRIDQIPWALVLSR